MYVSPVVIHMIDRNHLFAYRYIRKVEYVRIYIYIYVYIYIPVHTVLFMYNTLYTHIMLIPLPQPRLQHHLNVVPTSSALVFQFFIPVVYILRFV